MIRHDQGSHWLLFTQHDHALLAGRLAEQFGNGQFAKPSPQTIQGIALHDCGWPLHDDRPTLNSTGQPLHVFESPVWIGCQVWSASARRAANKDRYAGLLVSIHAMHLATIAAQHHRTQRDAFELNKFQHSQVELQEALRGMLGMRTDIPVNHGLAKAGLNAEEDQLRFDYHLLRAMDYVSLSLLCSESLSASVEIEPQPAANPLKLSLARPKPFTLNVDPWPFESPRLEYAIPSHRLAVEHYPDVEAFQDAFNQSPTVEVLVVVETLG
ncbi:MAG TPA: DUF3891 family protein [Tepidisphaeraceae bacterium]|jgi:hypothetical protein